MKEYEEAKQRSQSELAEKQLLIEEAETRIQSLTEALEKAKENALAQETLVQQGNEKNKLEESMNEMAALQAKNALLEEHARKLEELVQVKVRDAIFNHLILSPLHDCPQNHDDQDEMTKETVQKLSKLIRDKDLEIESLEQRNQSMAELVDKSSQESLNNQLATLEKEKSDLYEALTKKHQESVSYYNEIQRLCEVRLNSLRNIHPVSIKCF
jgi:hypothetical protein